MADFHPETTVYLFESTGVDAENQPFFTSQGAKLGWYNSHKVFTFNNYSYQRENRGFIRVKEKAGNLRKCDMMAWQNSQWKWIFADILSIEFINPNTTEISFKVDYMQTFIEDIEWCDCWIEREMQSNDWNGSVPSFNNLQPEGLETGMMKRTPEFAQGIGYTDLSIVVLSAYDEAGEVGGGGVTVKAGYPESLNTIVMGVNEPNRLNAMISTYAEKGRLDGIQGIYLCPSAYANSTSLYERTETVPPNYAQIDGYTPNNAKCFSGEFFHLELSNRRGNSTVIYLDHMANPESVVLAIAGAFCGGSGGMILYPLNYPNGKDHGVIVYNDIQVPYVGNGFDNWIAQNKYNLLTDVLMTGGSAIAGMATGNVALSVGALGKAMSTASKVATQTVNPLGVGGQSAGSGLPVSTNMYGFLINWVHPLEANIRCIDEFFSRFGYRTNRCKKPNVNTRPLWNYVKTAGAIVKGPFDYAAKTEIQNNMDNGVTFWHVPAATIGDYSNMPGNKE